MKEMITDNTIVKDITGEYIAVVAYPETAYVKNVTSEMSYLKAEDLDETSEGWVEVSLEEAADIVSAGTIVDEA